ncbi:hypothetical protein [Candidatus Rhodobacter oscarellae]|uniref:hypothetical protein n=1 Tax=Candidatus Rhodobacter oscarellae TaxID=1675527 RepID=UPI000B033693|nr:hypothetical protein [Candidatus Rhodobacter lobularis]
MKRFLCIACSSLLLAAHAERSNAAVDEALDTLLTDCWDAVDGGGLDYLTPYKMAFHGVDEWQTAINEIWRGKAVTASGEIDVKASIREGVLFDCTLLTFPTPDGADAIEYYEAQDTLDHWFGARYARPHHHDTFPEYRLHAMVRCDPRYWAVSASATTMAPFIDEVLVGATEKLTGELRFAAFITDATRYEVCG